MRWLILRGLVREQRHWGSFKEIFEEKLKSIDPNSQVFAMDMPGFGTEISRRSPLSVDGIVEDMRKRLQNIKKENDEPWAILAVSLGGMVAAHWANKYPNDFKKIILINSSMGGISPIHHRMRPKNIPHILRLLSSTNLKDREKTILQLTTNLPPQKIEEVATRHASYTKHVNKLNAVSQIFAGSIFKAPTAIKVPMLVLVGEGDKLVEPQCSYAIAKRYGAKICKHPTGNHDLATDEPQWIAEQVALWA